MTDRGWTAARNLAAELGVSVQEARSINANKQRATKLVTTRRRGTRRRAIKIASTVTSSEPTVNGVPITIACEVATLCRTHGIDRVQKALAVYEAIA